MESRRWRPLASTRQHGQPMLARAVFCRKYAPPLGRRLHGCAGTTGKIDRRLYRIMDRKGRAPTSDDCRDIGEQP
jgi:hypothetical protein